MVTTAGRDIRWIALPISRDQLRSACLSHTVHFKREKSREQVKHVMLINLDSSPKKVYTEEEMKKGNRVMVLVLGLLLFLSKWPI